MAEKFVFNAPNVSSKASDHKPPVPPQECSVGGCHNETVVAIAEFITPKGQRIHGFYSDLNREGNTFSHYITRCSTCYSRDVQRSNRAQMQQPGKVEPEPQT